MATSAQVRRWAKTGATQRRILDAATEVLATRAFAAATMADVVVASGASIGSICHHFGELDKSGRGQLLSRILVATMAESSLVVAATIDWIARIIE